jgi:hypothetical protein
VIRRDGRKDNQEDEDGDIPHIQALAELEATG